MTVTDCVTWFTTGGPLTTTSSTESATPKRVLRKAATRANVLQASVKVFTEGSVVNTPLDEVAKEAGVSKATLFFHFGSRIELLEAVAKELFRYGVDTVWQPSQPGLAPFLHDYLAAQRVPETRLLWEIGDVLTVAGRPGPDFAYDFTMEEIEKRLNDEDIDGEMRILLARMITAAVLHVARRAAFGLADDEELERLAMDVDAILAPWRSS